MTLLSSFEVVHYRGIDGLTLPCLSHANLVTGVNGVGKTALLEAIWLFMGRYNPAILWNANVIRSTSPVLNPIDRLSGNELVLHGSENGSHHRFRIKFEAVSDMARPAKIGSTARENIMQPPVVGQLPVVGRIDTYIDDELSKGEIGGMQPTPWGLVIHENPTAPEVRPSCIIESTKFQLETPDEYLQRYSDIVRGNRKKELVKAVNLILPRVKDLEILTGKTGESYVSAITTDGRILPLQDLGGGVVRLYRMLLDFFTSRNGILLVDEMENGIHHSVLEEVWSHVRLWMQEWNVQLVATTHSAECIDAAVEAFADAPENLSIHKLFTDGVAGTVGAMTFTGETLDGARNLNLEVR